jgi:hypothetical protein
VSVLAVLFAIGSIAVLRAQLGVGNWTQTVSGKVTGMTMTVEACCGTGYKLTYHIPQMPGMLMTVESALDGKDAPVMMGGKPTGETFAMKRIDATHVTTVMKMNGQQIGSSKAALSADGKTLTIETDMSTATPGQAAGKQLEIWTKK